MADTRSITTPTYAITSGLAAASLLLYMWQKRRLRDSKGPLPPSLKAQWIIGHLRSMPPGSDHTYFAKLGQDLNSELK